MKGAEIFAYNEYKDYLIYKTLAEKEKNLEFKKILENFIEQEWQDYNFWLRFINKKISVSKITILKYLLMRKLLGLTFTVKFLETREHKTIEYYTKFLETINDQDLKKEITEIITHEREHELKLANQINEERVHYLGNVILGLNDALIEISGSLVGFAFAYWNNILVVISGIIVGLSATLSMTSSSYLQAKHERDKSPVKAALYTGLAYFFIIILLILPFIIFKNTILSLILMFFIILIIISALAYYSHIIFDYSLKNNFIEMLSLSLGVALVSFIIGNSFKKFINLD